MTKITVEIELDSEKYDAKYGPGSAHWAKYCYAVDSETGIRVPRPASEYKPMVGQALRDAVVDTLSEGFYDWHKEGWLKLTVDGKRAYTD